MEKSAKAVVLPTVMSPGILVLGLLAAVVVIVGVTGKQVPILSNQRVDIVLLVVMGMAMCAQGGIGRVAATGQWWHALSIVGYVLGGLILLVAVAALAGVQLSLFQGERQALIAIAVLAGLKVLVSAAHSILVRD
jgi:hypothetical protein